MAIAECAAPPLDLESLTTGLLSRAFANLATTAAETGSLQPVLADAGLDPETAEGLAWGVVEHVLKDLPDGAGIELSQLIVIGLCAGLHLRGTRSGTEGE